MQNQEIILCFEPEFFSIKTKYNEIFLKYDKVESLSFQIETVPAFGYTFSSFILTMQSGVVLPYKFKFPAEADFQAFKIKLRSLMFQMIPKKEYDEHIFITLEGV